jgi:hypothetical protein
MSPRGHKQRVTFHRIESDRISPDDIQSRLMESVARQPDTRTEAQRWLGECAAPMSALPPEG